MADQNNPAGAPSTDEEPIPFMQRVLDNPFLLLFLLSLIHISEPTRL